MELKKLLKDLLKKYIKHKVSLNEKKKLKKKKELLKNIVLTEEQVESIDEIWIKNYGKKISNDWHRLYTSYTGNFDKYYFPEIFFTTNLLKKLNPDRRKEYLADKILTKSLFQEIEGVRLMENYIYNCNGYFYDKNGIITYNEALEKISNIGEVIIKPTVDTNSGNNVNLLNIKNGIDTISNKKISEILKRYNINYMIQEKLEQHELFSKLNPSSVNTIRVNTYICDGNVYCAPIAMRLGKNGSIVDNAHAGGITIGVSNDGILKKYAFIESGEKFLEHPDTKIKFEGYRLPKIAEMVNFAKKYHYKIPHMGIIAWDLALDKNENIVIIETNTSCPSIWFPQYCNGEAFFGENTEKMIRMLK